MAIQVKVRDDEDRATGSTIRLEDPGPELRTYTKEQLDQELALA